jgi:transcriptional regulator with XRE-family HTH domain
MDFAERFSAILDKRGITPYKMSKDTGIPEATIGRWKNGKATPNFELLTKASQYLGVTADYLIGNEHKNSSLPEMDSEQLRMFNAIKAMSKEKQKALLEMIEMFENQNKDS